MFFISWIRIRRFSLKLRDSYKKLVATIFVLIELGQNVYEQVLKICLPGTVPRYNTVMRCTKGTEPTYLPTVGTVLVHNHSFKFEVGTRLRFLLP